MNSKPLIRKPSAFLPLTMSLAALALVVGYATIHGTVQQSDEGTAARIFQLLLVSELPIVAFFAIRWLPKYPRQALQILVIQAFAGLAAIATVVILEH